MQIVITGGLGFIGSHFVNHLLENHTSLDKIIILDKGGVGSNYDNIKRRPNDNIQIVNIDLSKVSPDYLDILGETDFIVHFAAESHVDRSINSPVPFIQNNINAILPLVEYVRKNPNTRMINVSTDEVYGSFELDSEDSWDVDSPISPNSPYSASKAACDLICQSYNHTYGTKIITTRCTNNFGINQGDEKFIPTVVRSIVNGLPVPVYGKGDNIREWVDVNHHVQFIRNILFYKVNPEPIYHIGDGNAYSNLDIIHKISAILNKEGYDTTIKFVQDRKGHDKKYALKVYGNSITNEEEFDKQLEVVVKDYMVKYIIENHY